MTRRQPNITQLARDARDLIEHINRATAGPVDIPAPQISATTQALLSLVQRLPQAIEQLGWALDRQARADAIRMDNGTEPEAAVATVKNALADTVSALNETAEHLQHAATPLFSMAAK
ncbi:hypothetical protein TR51_06510 [Kitasatospora griseola]|uniref:Uncharacterized protein n=1 Tax=Kitasatospora griseola TaxID=2064 RepID=A0A0D0NFF5_KITGR|nr:hypothetical protein [Kitasatospora griseola]KIQ67035.1 hypothetical protein TR51_06510 [Kitasatospora griseola]